MTNDQLSNNRVASNSRTLIATNTCHVSNVLPLTHCGIVTPYGYLNLGQHWLRQWLIAWRHQVIIWTNVDLPLAKSRDNYLMIRFYSSVPGANELTISTAQYDSIQYIPSNMHTGVSRFILHTTKYKTKQNMFDILHADDIKSPTIITKYIFFDFTFNKITCTP